jgi:uncharacterized membrane protein YedE/YeeE
MTEFTPIASLTGGALIGLSAVLVMLVHGRIAGVGGFIGRILPPWTSGGQIWQLSFLLGLMVSPIFIKLTTGLEFAHVVSNDKITMIASGLIVGLGAGIGNGCTSGHGLCGISRLSMRSVIATITFITFGFLTVFIIRHVVGG